MASVGDKAFRGCSGLNSVTIPNSMASVGNDAFSGCPIEVANVNAEAACSKDVLGTKLKMLVIGDDVQSIAGSAFSGCSSLKELSLGKNVKTIGQSAFSGCAALTNLTISENVETLGDNCFNGCTSLKELSLGKNVKTIGQSAFAGCAPLENLTIGENVETLGDNCFDGCSALKEVILGKSLRSIGSGAFGGADRIENIYSLNPVPPTCAGESAFHEYAYKSAVVYVPNERNAIARYKADAVWSKFFEIYEKDMTNVGVVIPEYTITTSPEGYATFYSSEAAYALPNGLSAQVVTACSKNKLTYKTIADGSVSGIIPKGTAVMLVSEAKKAGTFKLTPAETATSYTGTNLLHGSDEATTTTASGTNYYYKLTYGEGAESEIFGWYWGAEEGAAFQIDGNKAWLALPKSLVTRSGFALDEETAIEEVITEKAAVYYDLQGRRIGTPTASGIYIVNGKKVMIKK
ncbi:MAG: leucine-rich repeat domain-containing protein [Bacteroidales bacterium]|nr:leucine-rich repeat domain-containing protein [Bacteroidales bacterium]